MAQLQVVEWPAKVLETKAEVVTHFDAELREFVKAMHATMDASGGIGLAANQVGVLKRVLTILIPYHSEPEEGEDNGFADPEGGGEERQWWHDKRFTFINPVVARRQGKARYIEGCLSFPEVYDYVDRAAQVTIKAFDEHGKEFEVEAEGWLAICLQHEIDHLDGIVFINRMSRLKAQMIKKKVQKRQLTKAQAEV